jgi:hypothetical protein
VAINSSNEGKRFYFKNNGYGHVKYEVRAPFNGWFAVIQVLEFEDNEHIANGDNVQLRFGYLNADGKLIARPLYLEEKQLAELGRLVSLRPEVKPMLKSFVDALK